MISPPSIDGLSAVNRTAPPATVQSPQYEAPGTIRRTINYLFGINQQFRETINNNPDASVVSNDPSAFIPEPVYTPTRQHQVSIHTVDTPITLNHSRGNSSISSFGFHVGNTVHYTMTGYAPVTAVITSIDDSDPLQTFYDLKCCDGSTIDTVAKYLSTIPTAVFGTFSLFDKAIYSKQGSIPVVVTVVHTDHPAYIVKRHDGSEVATISKYLSVFKYHDSWNHVLPTPETLRRLIVTSPPICPDIPVVIHPDGYERFSPTTKSTLQTFSKLNVRERTTITAAPICKDALFDGTPLKIRDLQVQLGEFVEIEHLNNTGFLFIDDYTGVKRNIFRDTAFLKLTDFEKADKLQNIGNLTSDQDLRKISTLLFQKLQNLCTPDFQTTMRTTYKDFYGTSFFLYYAHILEHCNLSGVGVVIDMEQFMEQLTNANLIVLFKTHHFNVIKFFADVVRIVESLHRIGGKHDSLCGPVLAALATCPDKSFVRYVLDHRKHFVLNQGPLFTITSDSARFDLLRKDAVAEYALLTKDNRYETGLPADGFVLVGTRNKPSNAVSPTSPSTESSTNRKEWEFHPPLKGGPTKKTIDNRVFYWCTAHAKSRYSTAFVNTGQWVTHKTSDCRLQKLKDSKKSANKNEVTNNSTTIDTKSAETSVGPANIKVENPSYKSTASSEMLPMRAKLKAMIDNADVTKMASLYAAAMAEQLDDGEDL